MMKTRCELIEKDVCTYIRSQVDFNIQHIYGYDIVLHDMIFSYLEGNERNMYALTILDLNL